jgi:SAM-dependent methyltransferase
MERLYTELAWAWPLLSPHEQYAEEAALYAAWLRAATDGPVREVLELGAGGGHVARHLPAEWSLTLVDRAAPMLEQSRRLNPAAAHLCADLTTLRLERRFDAVLLHDAVMYLHPREALAAAFATAAAHLRPGGGFVVLPDVVRETFSENTTGCGGEAGDRAARLLEWQWDPDPSDESFQVEMTVLAREGGRVRCVHEAHTMALYDRRTYARLLREAGFELIPPEPWDTREGGEVFVARRGPG